jgi:hypothetical protein
MKTSFYCNECFADTEEECICNRILAYDPETGVPIVDLTDAEETYLRYHKTLKERS